MRPVVNRCRAPARIAIDLYDMNGDLGRIDGGIGFSLQSPQLEFSVQRSASIEVHGATLDSELHAALLTALTTVQEKTQLGGVSVEVTEAIPCHIGLGSKTATLMATCTAYGQLYGEQLNRTELASLLGRGGTSGLGVNLFDRGGFAMDGGHRRADKEGFLPSSASSGTRPPPLLAHHRMPAWPVLIVVPDAPRMFGDSEVAFFRDVCPVPAECVERLARVTLSLVLPAVVEDDLATFCRGITAIQESTWKRAEIGVYGDTVERLRQTLTSLGAWTAGMSSIGPAVYSLGGPLERIAAALKGDYPRVELTLPDNSGVQQL